ncbi:RAMP superfamily CRISPR-associated protein, partial [Candidatus Contendibacter odensensis]|uniref:RAMP superfamily CRISPR-associated protein n=1 Tax=Candidatus Contendibacter odensensis TaxID=1400860 RepID=UPI0005542240
MSFDMLADEAFQPQAGDWLQQGARLRRDVRCNADLTAKRTVFLHEYAIANANGMGQGEAAIHHCQNPALLPTGLNTAARPMERALAGFPRYSARLLLSFRLLTPLLTKDDDPFYLFDNPARKDHLLGLPYLSAASLKGLSADAYQRAFPNRQPWLELGKDDPDRTRAFRHADPHAKRLFGIADDGVKIENEKNPSEAGRLHFSPVWFNNLQLLVINPSKAETAMGTQPIHFEAVAPDQTGVLEVVYFNPHGIKDSDEATVRADLARWLAAVASWWPVLGLGAKRLAGYGAIEILKVELQALDWTGMAAAAASTTTAAPVKKEPPPYYPDYLLDGAPITQDAFDAKLQTELEKLDADIKRLNDETHSKDAKIRKRAQREHIKATNLRCPSFFAFQQAALKPPLGA